MLLFIVSYLGGVLTILSPCILPVLPFVFARADKPFIKSGLPLLLGMALTFAAVATLAAVGGGWAVRANEYGRWVAMALLAIFGVTLLFPHLSDWLTRPLVSAGARLSQVAADQDNTGSSVAPSFLLGVATGLLWAPCAGPILGLVLSGAALKGANVQTSVLLFAYALGAATSLALALLIGGRVFSAMKRSLGVGEWIRRGLGVLVIAGVVAIGFGLDTGFLTQVSLASPSGVEQALIDKVRPPPTDSQPTSSVIAKYDTGNDSGAMMSVNPAMMMKAKPAAGGATLPVEGQLPSLAGAVEWLNTPPLTAEGLRGKVVVVDFWTYSCINCLRSLPYVKAWADKYRDQGLVVIGVHAPEFAFEKNVDNVKQAIKDLKVDYPVAIDNDYAIWQGFNNQYWPAHYFIDARGRIRAHHFGEGEYDKSEQIIQQLLKEAGKTDVAGGVVSVDAKGAQAAADMGDVISPETYIGYDRADNFIAPSGMVVDKSQVYAKAGPLDLNQWTLSGDWTVDKEKATLNAANGGITYRFHARDLHLVLGPGSAGKPVRFRVLVDGKPPGEAHGADIDADGNGTITGQRLYQLVRQGKPVEDHTFEIEFQDPGAEAFAFTFG
jgi:cytochrome c biogenesis protein CcdA/thiol-disulfide isomerase/thioredoxin